MNELQIFENTDFGQIRITLRGEEPWFVGKDVAMALGYERPTKAVNDHVDVDDLDGIPIRDSIGRMQNTPFINESGLYSLVLSSKLPTARQFKRWVTNEILPSIRKHGAYMTEDTLKKAIQTPDFLIQLATELKTEQERSRALAQKVEESKPAVLFYEAVNEASGNVLIRDLAKILCQNGLEIGQNRLFTRLCEEGFLLRDRGQYSPSQRATEQGLFWVQERIILHNGENRIARTVLVTPKGQTYFVNKYLEGKKPMKRTIGKRDAFIEVQKANYDLCEYADRCAKEGKDGFPIDYDSLPESIKSKDPKVERIERALCENANSQYKVSSKKYVS